MKTKKVIALMMAATLATTSSGVTTLAQQVDGTVEGMEAEEADEELKRAAAESEEIEVTATPKETECNYGDTVEITAEVKIADGKTSVIDENAEKVYELIENDEVAATNSTGVFSIQPKKDATYKVKATVSLVGQKQKVYAEKTVDAITVNPKDIAVTGISVPTFDNIVMKDESEDNRKASVILKDQLDKINESYKEWGTWSVAGAGEATEPVLKAATKTVDLIFESNGNYTFDGENTFDKKVSVSVVQMATGVAIVADEGDEPLVIGTNSKKDKKVLTATVAPDDTSNTEVEWKSSDESKVKVTPGKNNTAVITALGATEKEVTITATAKDGSEVFGEYQVEVKEGVSASDFKFPEKLDDFTYDGAGALSDYYEDVLKELNGSTDKGVYYFKDDAVVNAGEITAQLAFKLNDPAAVTTDAADTWTEDAADGNKLYILSKEYTIQVAKKVVDNTSSIAEIVGEIKDTYSVGTKLYDIIDPTKVNSAYEAKWYKVAGDGSETAIEAKPTDALPMGKLTGYVLKYSLVDDTNYVLKDEKNTSYTPSVTIVGPELSVSVEETSAGDRGDKYAVGANITLTADGDMGAAADYYDLSYQWCKTDATAENGYTKIESATSAAYTISGATAESAGEYFCIVTADINATGEAEEFYKADKNKYVKFSKNTDKISIAVTNIVFADPQPNDAANLVYGSTEKATVSATVTADEVKSYRVYYKSVDEEGKEGKEETTVTEKEVDEADAYRFSKGNEIKESIGNVNAGSYNFYIEVTTADDSATSAPISVTVGKQLIDAESLKEENVKAEPITYGQKLSDAVIVYGDGEEGVALKIKEDEMPAAGEKEAYVIAYAANDNYDLEETELAATFTVNKAALTVAATDETITEGDAAKLEITSEGLVNNEALADTGLTAEATVNNSKDTKSLSAGSYAINVTLTGTAANYDVTTKDGTLIVTEKTVTPPSEEVAVTGVTVDKTEVALKVGGTEKVTATVAPENATNKTVAWTTSNDKVATVASDGTITGVGAGVATVTAKAGDKSAEVKVTVTAAETPAQEEVAVAEVKIDQTAVAFDTIGATTKVTAIVTPENATHKEVAWTTSNDKVATVASDGTITATGNGTATVTVTAGGKSAAVTVTVSQKTEKVSITLGGQKVSGTLKAKKGAKYQFKAVVAPTNADKKNAKVKWKTSNKKVATVTSNGKVTVKQSGKTVTITATTADGKKASVKLKTQKSAVKVTKLAIKGNKTMKVKGTQKLKLTVNPATADNAKVAWSSSNTKVATVDKNGKVTAKKKGTVTITAKAKDGSGKKATIKITVKK